MTRWIKTNIGVIITLTVIFVSIVSQFVVAQYQISDLKTGYTEIKSLQQFDHDNLTAMRQDIVWIRKVLEKWESK